MHISESFSLIVLTEFIDQVSNCLSSISLFFMSFCDHGLSLLVLSEGVQILFQDFLLCSLVKFLVINWIIFRDIIDVVWVFDRTIFILDKEISDLLSFLLVKAFLSEKFGNNKSFIG